MKIGLDTLKKALGHRHFKKISGFLASLIFFIILLALINFPGKAAAVQKFKIAPGTGFNEIADRLKSGGLIRSETVFKIYNLLTGQARRLKAGTYILSNNFSIIELSNALTAGPSDVSVLISPGMTLKEADEKLSFLNVIEPGELINFNVDSLKNNYPWLEEAKSFEGFILPDSYDFFLGSDADSVARKFLDSFALRVLPFFKRSDSILKTLILASLLEKEIPDYGERQIVAGILIKRLEAGMPLQVDASVIYAKCAGKFLNCPPLQEQDYKIDSPYNTYLYNALPEGPICNPDLDAIKAVLFYKKSDYWYYLSDPKTKKTIFAKTLDEQNQNRAKYLLNN